jgi:uncharacterized repeat protein (TIGR01451 family)
VPHLTLTNTAVTASFVRVGDLVEFRIIVRNDGTTVLTGVSVSDPDAISLSCSPRQPVTLEPSAEVICAARHRVTAADVAAGRVLGVAEAVGAEVDALRAVAVVPEMPPTDGLAPQPGGSRSEPTLLALAAVACLLLLIRLPLWRRPR